MTERNADKKETVNTKREIVLWSVLPIFSWVAMAVVIGILFVPSGLQQLGIPLNLDPNDFVVMPPQTFLIGILFYGWVTHTHFKIIRFKPDTTFSIFTLFCLTLILAGALAWSTVNKSLPITKFVFLYWLLPIAYARLYFLQARLNPKIPDNPEPA